jgi:small subunit ribosomal protein S6e
LHLTTVNNKNHLTISYQHPNTQFLIERCPTFITLPESSSIMAKFKVIVSDPEAGTSKVVELEEARAAPLIGRRIGEVIDGSIVDLPGHKAQIRGGSDKDGFPMRPSVHGGVRRRIVLSGGVGFTPLNEGSRRRKTVRGNVITEEIVQINMKITEKPKQTKETKKPKEKKEEKPTVQKETQPQKPASTQQQPDTTTKT